MSERPKSLRYKLLSACAGIGFAALGASSLLIENIRSNRFPPSLEVTTRFNQSLTFYKEGVVYSVIRACNSIPIYRKGQVSGDYLSGGRAIQKKVLHEKDPSIHAYGSDDFSGCDRPWVNQSRQAVQ